MVTLATRSSMPAIFDLREFVAAGGLMSYGTSLTDRYRQAAMYTGRILKRAQPARPADPAIHESRAGDQPQDRKRRWGSFSRLPLLGRADEVIE